MNASMEDQGPFKQLSSASAQLRVSTPKAPQQLGVHEIPIHLNRHVELHRHSKAHGHVVHEKSMSAAKHIVQQTRLKGDILYSSGCLHICRACISARYGHHVSWHHAYTAAATSTVLYTIAVLYSGSLHRTYAQVKQSSLP